MHVKCAGEMYNIWNCGSANFLKGKYLEEYMALNMETGNGKVGQIES
jgi:hypothetical protein